MEKNKTGKYLKYAVGEIILVVIGILIALQINNWNEQRKITTELNDYLQKISDNVNKDIEQIEKLKIRRDTVKAKARRASKALVDKDFSNIEGILFDGQSCFYEFYFIPNKSGFEALKNSLYLSKINNTKVDGLLSQYYSLVNKTNTDELSYNSFIENMEAQLSIRIDGTPFIALQKKLVYNEDISINDYQDILPYIQDNAFKSAVYRTVREGAIINNYPKLIELGNDLIQEIDKNYSEK